MEVGVGVGEPASAVLLPAPRRAASSMAAMKAAKTNFFTIVSFLAGAVLPRW